MTVLAVTHSAERQTFDAVAHALALRGTTVFRLDTDRFPTDLRAAIHCGRDGNMTITGEQGELDLTTLSAVWYRRFDPGARIPRTFDPQVRYAAIMESRRALFGLLVNLDVFHLDPMLHVRRAESKQWQLALARRCGLSVPRTLITNDPAAARTFALACPKGLIAKMLEAASIETPDGIKSVFASVVTTADLAHLDDLRLAPMMFQERIEPHREIRATIVGKCVFAAEIDTRAMSPNQVDWRRDPAAVMTAWHSHDLPAPVAKRLLQLMDFLSLNYGAADLILTPDGDYVFLEVNPLGQFHWLELHAGLPISGALADVLTRPDARRAFITVNAKAKSEVRR